MSENSEFFASRWRAERPVFVKVFRALPADKLDYRPHERSNPAGNLVWLLAREQRALTDLIDTGDIHWAEAPRPGTLDEMIAAFEKNADGLAQRLESLTDDRWNAPGRFLVGGQPVISARVQDIAWFFLFDGIHHRGQLSSYIRPMGGKVPAIYGPSGDESPF